MQSAPDEHDRDELYHEKAKSVLLFRDPSTGPWEFASLKNVAHLR